ncbi:MAG TPA: hypothetical protein VK027_08110 [Chitinophagaceae bacterium]|nr:hypothetical protein [Chitinophagaceae bacterium]
MKNGKYISVFSLLIIFIGIVLIDINHKDPIDWTMHFRSDKKSPYGTYVLEKELNTIFNKDANISKIQDNLYNTLSEGHITNTSGIVYVDEKFYEGRANITLLLEAAESGSSIFIATERIESLLRDTLGFKFEDFNESKAKSKLREELNIRYYLSNNSEKYILLDRVQVPKVFTKMDKDKTEILGSVEIQGKKYPNFIRIKYGKGEFLIHIEPVLFTNYYLLQEEPFFLAHQSLSYIKKNNIFWYNSSYEYKESYSTLRVLLNNRGLATAWRLLLIGAILFMIFKSKREQKAIPIVNSEKNQSLEFARIISSLYYENGNPKNMIKMKINHFLFVLRKSAFIETENTLDERFISTLSQKYILSEKELYALFFELKELEALLNPSEKDLKRTQYLIEKFKEKINL